MSRVASKKFRILTGGIRIVPLEVNNHLFRILLRSSTRQSSEVFDIPGDNLYEELSLLAELLE